MYHRIRNIAVQLNKETSDHSFYPGHVLMAKGPLLKHPGYYYILHLIIDLAKTLNENVKASDYLVPGYEANPDINAKLTIDFYTACPGIPKFRTFLVSHFAPPCIRLVGGEIWKLRLQHLKESYPDMSLDDVSRIDSELQTVAEQLINIDGRWLKFRLASSALYP